MWAKHSNSGPMTAASGLYRVACNIRYNRMTHYIRGPDSIWSCRLACFGSHCGGKMVVRSSYFGIRISCADEISSLCWVRPRELLYFLLEMDDVTCITSCVFSFVANKLLSSEFLSFAMQPACLWATYSRVTLYTAGHLHTAMPYCWQRRTPLCTQPCPIVDKGVPPLCTQPCPWRTMSTAVCIYVAGLCASCPAV